MKLEVKEIAEKFAECCRHKMGKHGGSITRADHKFLSDDNIKYVSAINEYWKNQEGNVNNENIIENNNDFQNDKQGAKGDNNINGIANFARDFSFGKEFYYVSDIHGDLNMLLHALISSGAARFKKGQNSTIYYNIKTGKVCKKFGKLPKDKSFLDYVQIPNIEPNPDFKGKFVLGGDLIDRGLQSRECLCSVLRFMKQMKKKKRGIDFNYLLGDHESQFIGKMSDKNELRLVDVDENNYLKKQLIKAVENNDVKTAILLKNDNGKTMVISHAVFTISNLVLFIKDSRDDIESLITDKVINKSEFFGVVEKLCNNQHLVNGELDVFVHDLNKIINYCLLKQYNNIQIGTSLNDMINLAALGDYNRNNNRIIADYQICGHIHKVMANMDTHVLSVDSNGSNGYYKGEGYSTSVPTMLCRNVNEGFKIKQVKLNKGLIMDKFYNQTSINETEVSTKKKGKSSKSSYDELVEESENISEAIGEIGEQSLLSH